MCKVAQIHLWRYNRHKLTKAKRWTYQKCRPKANLPRLFRVFDTCRTGGEEVCAWQNSTAELAQLRAVRGSALPAPPPALTARYVQEAQESLSWNHKALLQGLKPTSSPTSEHLLSYGNVSVLRNVWASKKISCRPQFWFWVPHIDCWFVSFLPCGRNNSLSQASSLYKDRSMKYSFSSLSHFLLIQLSFQRTRLGSRSNNNPFSLQYLIEACQRWPLHSITTNSAVQILYYIGQDFGLFPGVKAAVLRDHMHTEKPAIGTGTLPHVETPFLRGDRQSCSIQLLKGEDKRKDEKIREWKKKTNSFVFCFCLCVGAFVCF